MSPIARTAWMDQARRCYINYVEDHAKVLVTGNRKARENEWWGPAAETADRFGCSAGSLVFAIPNHINDRPEDPHVDLHTTIYRSSGLMYRALDNYRRSLHDYIRYMPDAYMLLTGKYFEKGPQRIDESERLLAQLSMMYFSVLLEVKLAPVGEISDLVRDSVAYKLCGKNPFLLLSAVRTQQFRALAYGNAVSLAHRCPWHKPIWDHLIRGAGLDEPERLSGQSHQISRNFFETGKFFEVWPVDPLLVPFHQPPEQSRPAPVMRIVCPEFDTLADSRLALDAERIKQKFR